MANINYTLDKTNEGLRGGLKYLSDFNVENFNLQEFLTKMENVTNEAVTTKVLNPENSDNLNSSGAIIVTNFNALQLQNPGNYYIYYTSNTEHRPTDIFGVYGSLIVKNIGDKYLEQILTVYYKNKMHQYKRRAIKEKDDNNELYWSFTIGGDKEDKNNEALWIKTYNNSAIIPLEDGGTGTQMTSAPDNALIVKITGTWTGESKPQLYYKETDKGALHCKTLADTANNKYPEIKFGTLPIDCGGTGRTTSPSIIVNLASKNAVNILSSTDELKPGVEGTLPLSKGGTGRSLLTSTNVNGILRAPNVLDDDHGLLITRTNNGAMYATEQDGAPQFGILQVALGGTGRTTSPSIRVNLASKNAVNILSSTDELKPGVEGILPVSLGGTGLTSSRILYTLISGSDVYKTEDNKTYVQLPNNILLSGDDNTVTLRIIPYFLMGFIRGYLTFLLKSGADAIPAGTSFTILKQTNNFPLSLYTGTPLTVYKKAQYPPTAYFSNDADNGLRLVLPVNLNPGTAYTFYFGGWLVGQL